MAVVEQLLTLQRLLGLLGLADEDVLNVYLYGSRLWGTLAPSSSSSSSSSSSHQQLETKPNLRDGR